jgi:DNA primase
MPEHRWTATRLAINLLLQKPELANNTTTHHELGEADIPGVNLLLQLLDQIHDEPGISTQNLLARFKGDENESHLYTLAAMDPPIEDDASAEKMFSDCLQQLETKYIGHRKNQLICKLQAGEPLSEAEKLEHKKLFTNQL